MRIRVRPVLTALATAATIAVVSAGHAAAGGPTSVIVVNPMTGDASALYYDDPDYQVLHDALEPRPDGWVEQPGQLSAGPGTPAINITWLIHDVSVWRVDRVRLDLKYVWVQTNMVTDGAWPDDGGGQSWHVAARAEAVIGVFDRLGVLPDEWLTNSGWDITESAHGAAEHAGADEAAALADTPPSDPAAPFIVPSWQWLAVAAAGGIAVGAVGRPVVAAYLRRREQGPRQQLADLDGAAGSGQPDADSPKTTPLVLDLRDLNPADLAR